MMRDFRAQERFLMTGMTEQQITERLQKLWVQATASCGSATPQLVEEIRELEQLLEAIGDREETPPAPIEPADAE
jgi:chromosome condensin MukBEF complex kleisin-like MukF subunit